MSAETRGEVCWGPVRNTREHHRLRVRLCCAVFQLGTYSRVDYVLT